MSTTTTIRFAVVDDAALLRELRLEALASAPTAFAADYDTTAAETVEAWAQRIVDTAVDDKGVICVASVDDRLIGMAGLIRGNRPKTRHGATIWGVYVQPEWRGHHVAEALIDACLAWAQTHAVTIVKLAVVTTNTPAIRCYARCGFSVYGIEPKAICYDGVFYDELLMVKEV
jgi:RimJ/RimL family protein N-acetyltransferase